MGFIQYACLGNVGGGAPQVIEYNRNSLTLFFSVMDRAVADQSSWNLNKNTVKQFWRRHALKPKNTFTDSAALIRSAAESVMNVDPFAESKNKDCFYM